MRGGDKRVGSDLLQVPLKSLDVVRNVTPLQVTNGAYAIIRQSERSIRRGTSHLCEFLDILSFPLELGGGEAKVTGERLVGDGGRERGRG